MSTKLFQPATQPSALKARVAGYKNTLVQPELLIKIQHRKSTLQQFHRAALTTDVQEGAH